jgi:hypothetical protein
MTLAKIVRLDTNEVRLIITAVSENGSTVGLASTADPNYSLNVVPCEQPFPAEGGDVG